MLTQQKWSDTMFFYSIQMKYICIAVYTAFVMTKRVQNIVVSVFSCDFCCLKKFKRVFHYRMLLERCCQGFVLPVLEHCSGVWCPDADTHLKQLDSVVSGTSFFTGGVFKCDLAHRRYVAVLCVLHKIRCNRIHRLHGALPEHYVSV